MAVNIVNANSHFSSDQNFGKLLEPGLRKIFYETYGEVPEQFSKIFKVNQSKKAKETDFHMGALSGWRERTGGGTSTDAFDKELDPVQYSKIGTGETIEYVHKAYTNGFIISRELYEDDQYRQMAKMSKDLARSGRAFVENTVHTFINKGFAGVENVPIYDQKPLFANDHPLINSSKVGDNLVTGALNDQNLKIAMQCMREQVDEAGNLISASAKKLVVPPALEFTAKELVNSTQKAGTNDNDINTIKGALEVVVDDYLGRTSGGSDTAWYLVDPSLCELNFFWRIKPEFKNEEDFDTFAAKYRGYMRFSFGASDWRGIVGSTGA